MQFAEKDQKWGGKNCPPSELQSGQANRLHLTMYCIFIGKYCANVLALIS